MKTRTKKSIGWGLVFAVITAVVFILVFKLKSIHLITDLGLGAEIGIVSSASCLLGLVVSAVCCCVTKPDPNDYTELSDGKEDNNLRIPRSDENIHLVIEAQEKTHANACNQWYQTHICGNLRRNKSPDFILLARMEAEELRNNYPRLSDDIYFDLIVKNGYTANAAPLDIIAGLEKHHSIEKSGTLTISTKLLAEQKVTDSDRSFASPFRTPSVKSDKSTPQTPRSPHTPLQSISKAPSANDLANLKGAQAQHFPQQKL